MKQEENVPCHGYMNISTVISQTSSGYEYRKLFAGGRIESMKMATQMLLRTPHHILLERRRRELVNQHFVTLSDIIPGLEKRDRTSLLGGAIRYMKQLQENVHMLEEQAKKKIVESAVLVYKSRPFADEKLNNHVDHPLPEIEAKVLDRNVLIRIHWKNHNENVSAKALQELEKLPLEVVATSLLPLGSCSIDLTVIAQINNKVPIKAKDLVTYIQSAIVNFGSDS